MKQKTAVICLSRTNGGMELAAVKIANILAEDIEVVFFCRSHGFISQNRNLFQKNIDIFEFHYQSNFSLKLILQIRRVINTHGIKNIIFLGASEMKSLYFAALGLDINFIIRQGTTKSTSKKDIIHKVLYSKVNHFVGNSKFIVQNMKKILPISSDATLNLIYASVNIKKEIEYKKIDNKIDIIHLGRITKGKGQLEALKACKVLHDNGYDFKLKFLGDIADEKYFGQLQEITKNTDYKDKVEFLGYEKDIAKYLQSSDLFLFPTYGEGMSNAIIEALSFGLVCIIYDNTSTPEFKDLGFHLHLTAENSVESLQKTLLNIAHNIEDEKSLARQNYEKALQVFASQREKEQYMELLV